MRLPLVVIALMLAVLIPVGFATEPDPEEVVETTPIALIAERVEQLRGLEFKTTPQPLRVTGEQATEEGLADLDRAYPPQERAADEAIFTQLGLLPRDTDLRELSESIFGSQVAGYYDPRTGRLRIVEGSGTNRVVDEMTIAHELVHALEDQRIGIDLAVAERSDDAGYAYKAAVEGTATRLMYDYLAQHFSADTALGGLLASGIAAPSTAGLPPFIVAGLVFPYVEGELFVSDLYRRTDSWQLVDVALRDRPPVSTEQILHPEKWLAAEQPRSVRVPSPGTDWERVRDGVFGEWQTGQLLALGGRAQPEAAAGWGGDAYALYERDGQQALVMRWVHDSPGDRGEFYEALRTYAEAGLQAENLPCRCPGADPAYITYRLGDTVIAMSGGPDSVTLAFAPSRALAISLSTA